MSGKKGDTASPSTKGPMSGTELLNEHGVQLLDTIDNLRQLGIDKDIPLPQIIVVGSQSHGKSSVLEAISGIPFPISGGQCTTFVSEVRLRRSKVGRESASVSVVSGSFPFAESQPVALEAPNTDETDRLAWDQMPGIINRAADMMGNSHGEQICQDVLRIEVSGPNQDHLTLIDLPGLFHNPKSNQDGAAPQRVKNTVLRYMREKRSIILAVVSAKEDFANQEIMTLIDAVDPSGLRTLGIITGVDKPEAGHSVEAEYVTLAQNKTRPLALGWHVLRNLDSSERALGEDRDIKEREFFNNESRAAWLTIPEADRGAAQLKSKLSSILLTHVGKELGAVTDALELKIVETKKALDRLGPQRSSLIDQRVYLTEVGTRYHSLCKEALDGAYEDPFFEKTGQRLRAMLAQELDAFQQTISLAYRWDFWTCGQTLFGSKHHADFSIGTPEQFQSVGKSTHRVPLDEYLTRVDEVLRKYRGRELQGTFDPRLIGVLFKDQACYWLTIVRETVQSVLKLVKDFLEKVTMHVVGPRRAQILLRYKLLPILTVREKALYAKVEELIKPFMHCQPRTSNPRFKELLEQYDKQLQVRKDEAKALSTTLRDRIACEKLAVHMRAYYTIARATFIDNVVSLGIELCLLEGLPNDLAPTSITQMTDEQIGELASEFPDDAIQRQRNMQALEVLQNGLDICKAYDQFDLEDFSSTVPVITAASKVTDASFSPRHNPAKPSSSDFLSPRPSTTPRPRSRGSNSSSQIVSREASPIPSKGPKSGFGSTFSSASFGDTSSSFSVSTVPTPDTPITDLSASLGGFTFGKAPRP